MISQYWVGQIPARPLSMLVKSQDGANMNLSVYTTVNVKMLDSRNREVSLTGGSVNTNNSTNGQITFTFPTDRSLFTEKGDYVLQLELSGTGKLDYTTTHTIRVRELGKVIK